MTSIDQERLTPIKKTPNDYKFCKVLGEGSFSTVYLAIDVNKNASTTNGTTSSKKINKYAIKVCDKMYLKRHNKAVAVMREKKILKFLNENKTPFVIRLYCTFQDASRLFFVMTYANNGDLLTFMQSNKLSMSQVKRYSLELIKALEYIHKLDIIHRDLKPENILLDFNQSILLTDFGSAKICTATDTTTNLDFDPSKRRNSFVGTAQYVSPEMLKFRNATNMSDIWAYGIIIYQMITNIMPFNAPNEYLIYQKILGLDYDFSDDFDADAKSLITSIIQLNPEDRLGFSDNLQENGYKSIREHSFIQSYDSSNTHAAISSDVEIDCDSSEDRLNLSQYEKVAAGLDETRVLQLLTST